MSITIQHIADELNVSVSTVSRSLRNDRLINPQTRAKIQATAMNLGYQGRIRRKTTRISSKVLQVVVAIASESFEAACVNSNYLLKIEGFEAEADAMGAKIQYEALPYETRGKLTSALLNKMFNRKKPDAIICVGHLPPSDVEQLSHYAPIVSLQWDYRPTPCDVVRQDEEQAFTQIVDQLVAMGHRRMIWVDGPQQFQTPHVYRKAAFIAALLQHQLPFDDQHLNACEQLYTGLNVPYLCDYTEGITQPEVLKQWIVKQGITALVCVNDRTAYNVLMNLKTLGIDVPGQVSVTGFDDQVVPDNMPKLMTVDPLFMEQGRTAMRMAQQRKERPTAFPQRVLHLCQLVEGQTTAPVTAR